MSEDIAALFWIVSTIGCSIFGIINVTKKLPDFGVESIEGPISVLATLVVYMVFVVYICYHSEQKKNGNNNPGNEDSFGMLFILLTIIAPMITGIMSLVDPIQEPIRLGATMSVVVATTNMIMLPVFNHFEKLKLKEKETQQQQEMLPPPPYLNQPTNGQINPGTLQPTDFTF